VGAKSAQRPAAGWTVHPFKSAWLAVKEFIETDGQLPKSIEWIANKELPVGTFPDPGSPHLVPD
jgi:hypothetical protein